MQSNGPATKLKSTAYLPTYYCRLTHPVNTWYRPPGLLHGQGAYY